MADTTKVAGGAGLVDDARKEKRRNRLQSLMGRRSDEAAAISVTAAPAAMGAGPMGEVEGADAQARRKAIARIYRVLTDTPADDGGMVEDTPFSKAGVARLMETLRGRAANEGQPGARVAAGLIKFLTPKDGEAEVHGVSLERLKRVAKTAGDRIGARGMGGARVHGAAVFENTIVPERHSPREPFSGSRAASA